MKISDEHLINQVASGSSEALEQLYHRFAKRVHHYVLRMLSGNEPKSQDILQDVFMTIIDKSSGFDSAYPASAWIFTIARNKCKNEEGNYWEFWIESARLYPRSVKLDDLSFASRFANGIRLKYTETHTYSLPQN